MNDFQILVPLTAIFFGGMAILIPVAGITARLAIKPVLAALQAAKGARAADDHTRYLEQRLSLLEEQYHALEREQQRLIEESDFRKQLESPRL